jgi:hypothetical protein
MRHGSPQALANVFSWALACLAAQVAMPVVWADVPANGPTASASVRVESNGVGCPSAEQVETALRQVGVFAATPDTGWLLAYGGVSSAAGTSQASFVWMDLTSPTGQLVARRQLPDDGSDCHSLASAMSAVVERSLHELGWTRGEPLPGGSRPTGPAPSPVPVLAARPPRLVLGLGPALGTSSRTGVNLALEARLQVVGSLSLRLGGGLLAKEESQAVGDGQARVSSRQVSATVLSTLPRGRVHLDVGAAFLVSIDQGSTQKLSAPAEGRRAALAAGLVFGGGVRLSPRWRLALDIQGLRAVAGADFVVVLDGARRAVLPPPTWQGSVCTKLEFVAWP